MAENHKQNKYGKKAGTDSFKGKDKRTDVKKKSEPANHRKPAVKDKQAAAAPKKKKSRCPVSKKCGGCTMIDIPYDTQLKNKQELVDQCIGDYVYPDHIIRMKNPDHYRNKVTSVFAPDRKGKPVCGRLRHLQGRDS